MAAIKAHLSTEGFPVNTEGAADEAAYQANLGLLVVGARVRPTIAYAQTWGYPTTPCDGTVRRVKASGIYRVQVAWDDHTYSWVDPQTLIVLAPEWVQAVFHLVEEAN